MDKDFLGKVKELFEKGDPFALATVVKTEGSASAKPGSKAIIMSSGERLMGWVGGGCAESTVQKEALASMKDGKPRYLTLDLDDEVLGVGMPCGGTMDVYVEPILSKPELLLIGRGRIVETLSEIGKLLNFTITVRDPLATKENYPHADQIVTDDPEMKSIKIGKRTYVVIATQHKGDHQAMKRVMEEGAGYVALVSSKKRAGLVFDYLREEGISSDKLKEVRAPSGLDIGSETPEEIALSIMSEIVSVLRGGSGRPLMEVKKTDNKG
jgi:xanthine dehydrogenase accessory factor